MSNKIDVLVADDSSIMRHLLADILREDKSLNIQALANNGREAITLACEKHPDVILMDLNMGEYDGLYAVENIMQECPTPIILISSSNMNSQTKEAARKMGVLDFINKPVWESGGVKTIGNSIIAKIKEVYDPTATRFASNDGLNHSRSHTFNNDLHYDVIAIGASTGGPTAVEKLLLKLPNNLPVPVLVSQHMPANFIESFSSRLNNSTPLTVKIAKAGEMLRPGHVYVAPARNMVVRKNDTGDSVIGFCNKQYEEYNSPSINALLDSVGKVYGNRGIGIVLTGMGKDGTSGLQAIKQNGGLTIAQDQETSVVYGMPKSAFIAGAVNHVLPLHEIGFFVVNCLTD